MLDQTINLNSVAYVDETDGSAAPASLTLRRHEETVNRTTYIDDSAHTVARRKQVQFYRTLPKRSGASRGSSKVAVKFTRDIDVPNASGDGTITLPVIGEVSFSLPVGVSSYQITNLTQEIRNLFVYPGAALTDLTNLLEI